MKRATLAVGVAGILVLLGCSGGTAPLSEGERLFRVRCARCHPLETPLGVRRDLEG